MAAGITSDEVFKSMADGLQWLKAQLPVEIQLVLSRHKVRSGYAVLAGVARSVWVLPLGEIKLAKRKVLRPEPVEVLVRI